MRPTTLYHGGPAGLKVGDLIRPAISLGLQRPPTLHAAHYSSHRVYVTQRLDYAQYFAHYHSGSVYEVLPVGRLLPDLDARGSFTCSAAEIVGVAQEVAVQPDTASAALSYMVRRVTR